MRREISDYLDYTGYIGQSGRCWYDCFLTDAPYTYLTVFTELSKNTGVSVTNVVERVATAFLDKYLKLGVVSYRPLEIPGAGRRIKNKSFVSCSLENLLENKTFIFIERYEDKPNEYDWVNLEFNFDTKEYQNPKWERVSVEKSILFDEWLKPCIIGTPFNSGAIAKVSTHRDISSGKRWLSGERWLGE